MKKKINDVLPFILVVLVLITILVSLLVNAFSDKNNVAEEDITVTSIAIYKMPKQYYVVGEEFSLDEGKIVVFYTDNQTGETKQKLVAMNDNNVSCTGQGGTSIADRIYTVKLNYGGAETSYGYYVQEASKAIESVTFSLDSSISSPLLFAKTDNRPYFDVGYLKGYFLTIKYRDESKEDTVYDLSDSFNYSKNELIYPTGWDATELGLRYITINYKVSSLSLPYEIIEEDWVTGFKFVRANSSGEYEEVDPTETIRLNYIVGDSFDANGVNVQLVYNSLNEYNVFDISDNILSGFDTSTPTGDAPRTLIISTSGGVQTLDYNVYEADKDVIGMRLASYTPGFLNVNDELTYEEFLECINLELVIGSINEGVSTIVGKIAIKASSSDIEMWYIKDNNLTKLTKDEYAKLLSKGGETELMAIYPKAHSSEGDAYCREFYLTVLNSPLNFEITDWDSVKKVYNDGDKFDFGDAEITVIYNDEQTKTLSLQEEYEKGTDRSIIIWDKQANKVDEFDMSVGEHTKEYFIYLSVSGYVKVDGSTTFDDNEAMRLYISYTVE